MQGFPTFLLPCTPSAFRQMSMYPFSISTDKHVPLQYFNRWTCTPKISWFCHDFHRYINNKHRMVSENNIHWYMWIFGNKLYINIFFSSIVKCNPSDRQMYPWGYMRPRLGTSGLEHYADDHACQKLSYGNTCFKPYCHTRRFWPGSQKSWVNFMDFVFQIFWKI